VTKALAQCGNELPGQQPRWNSSHSLGSWCSIWGCIW